ncbi:MAG TPA: branched-chain-amino-acid transaminase [Bacteroidia bacterium]|jgi:branched-chain amino acid aminotransferase|nr:branched-chain-amino-acid transaminase [Bacteroidia bacterium]
MYYNDKTILCSDGVFLPASAAHANLYGQTLHYGYGVFEGIRSYKSDQGPLIFKAREHFERLAKSCELLGIPFGYDVTTLTNLSYELLDRNKFGNAYIRPLVYCDPNMSLTRPTQVHLLICAWEWGAYLGDKMLHLGISSFCRPHPRSIKVEAKACGHYVNSILATVEAKDKGFDEALLLDHEGYLAEGPGANLFFGKGKTLYTPSLGCILPGITRATVMELCVEKGFHVVEGKFKPDELLNAEFAFYCGTAAEIVGIEAIDGKKLRGSWSQSAGKILQEAYLKRVHEKEPVFLKTNSKWN